jgi:hypothetical protein
MDTIANVAEDAIRWRKAMEVANEIVARERATLNAACSGFREDWDRWSYSCTCGGKPPHRERVPLPADWQTKVGELSQSGLPMWELSDAINATMSAQYVKNEFAYFLGVARNKLAARQTLAQELIRRGDV